MTACPICGLGERCRNHWVASEDAGGEVAFQTGVMTASEDNLILLRNKLKNPPLPQLFERIALAPTWVEANGRRLAYLPWPLDLRGAVHRTLFPNGAPGAPPLAADAEALPLFDCRLEDIALQSVRLDLENCLPDELLYIAAFELQLNHVGTVGFQYVGLLWAEGMEWARLLDRPEAIAQAGSLVQLMLAGIVDPLRAVFAGQSVRLLAEDATAGIVAGMRVDEVILPPRGDASPHAGNDGATPGETEMHMGEEIESLIHARRLQPLLRDCLLRLRSPQTLTQ